MCIDIPSFIQQQCTRAPVQALLGVEDDELVDHLRHLREEEGQRHEQEATVPVVGRWMCT